jgi:hypothetical protein
LSRDLQQQIVPNFIANHLSFRILSRLKVFFLPTQRFTKKLSLTIGALNAKLIKIILFKIFCAYLVCMQQANQSLYEEMYDLAFQRFRNGDTASAVKETLTKKYDDIVLITVAIKEARNASDTIKRKQGFILILVGCLTGLSGFLITFINFNTSRSIDFAMYGLTSAGITIVFWGLYKIIG